MYRECTEGEPVINRPGPKGLQDNGSWVRVQFVHEAKEKKQHQYPTFEDIWVWARCLSVK